MRLFTLVASALFTAAGIGMITSGNRLGWAIAGFFGLAALVALFEPALARIRPREEYRLVMTSGGIACEHPKRPREAIRWEDVNRIWYVTTSGGPRVPDEWILLEGEAGGCSLPTEAVGMDALWDELKRRFAGFDYGPVIRGGTSEARHLCWERPRPGGPPA